MKKKILLWVVSAGVVACSNDTPIGVSQEEAAALWTGQNQDGVEFASLLEYEVHTLVIRYTATHGPWVDSSRVRISEYEDGFVWSQVDRQLPAITSGRTLDGASVHYAGANMRGGWSADRQATYLPIVDNPVLGTDRAQGRRGLQSVPWIGKNPPQLTKPDVATPRPTAGAIQWRSAVAPRSSEVAERLAALRSSSDSEMRVAASQVRFRMGKTEGGNFVDATFDEAIGEVVMRTTYRRGTKHSTMTRDYIEYEDGNRLGSEIFDSYTPTGKLKLRVERTYSYRTGTS